MIAILHVPSPIKTDRFISNALSSVLMPCLNLNGTGNPDRVALQFGRNPKKLFTLFKMKC